MIRRIVAESIWSADERNLNRNSIVSVIAVNPSMRSTTNLLINNLAIADILFVLFCVPFTASDYVLPNWLFGNFWCKIVS